MKLKNLLIAAAGITVMLSSCGTIKYATTKGKAPVFMCNAPSDLRVSVDGKPMSLEREVFAARASDRSVTSYSAMAVNLPHKKKVTIDLSSGGKTASVQVKPKLWGKLLVLDLFIGGWVIDLPLGNMTTLKPRLIDVERALEGKPRSQWRSQGKLKRTTMRKAKRSY